MERESGFNEVWETVFAVSLWEPASRALNASLVRELWGFMKAVTRSFGIPRSILGALPLISNHVLLVMCRVQLEAVKPRLLSPSSRAQAEPY